VTNGRSYFLYLSRKLFADVIQAQIHVLKSAWALPFDLSPLKRSQMAQSLEVFYCCMILEVRLVNELSSLINS